jgi:hypothetical protein
MLLAGLLITTSQLVLWPLRRGEIIDTLTSPVYLGAMSAFIVGVWILILAEVFLHQRQAPQIRTFDLIALGAVIIGTANLAGNVWFDTFVAPWLAHQIPAALLVERNGSLVAGALLSYVLMAVGWILFGLAAFRARVIPRPLAVCIILTGPLAFAMLPPYSVVFGGVITAVGIWLSRHSGPLKTRGQ